MSDVKDPWLYHFTHTDNLPGIISDGLIADGRRPAMVTECAEPAIKQRRREIVVPIDPGGMVADYVPFYFAPRSPMLYRIHRGGVESYQRGQHELIYLLTKPSEIDSLNLPWVATDRNAALEPGRFAASITALEEHIDWAVMRAQLWKNTVDDGSRMQRRMAEFLVYQRVPWNAITYIATCSTAVATDVKTTLTSMEAHSPGMLVRPKWYF